MFYKKCTKCGEVQPADTQHFTRLPSGRLTGECRTCRYASARKRYAARQEPLREIKAEYKRKLETLRNELRKTREENTK